MKNGRAEAESILKNVKFVDKNGQNKGAAAEVRIEDPVLKEALRRELRIGPGAAITGECLRNLERLRVDGPVKSLRGLEHAGQLSEIFLRGALVDDLSPLYEAEIENGAGADARLPRLLRVRLDNHQARDVSFLERIPDESGVQVHLSGQGPTVEKAFEKYCWYEPVSFVKNSGDNIIYGKCALPWLFFEDGSVSYASDREEVIKVWGPFFGESVEIGIGEREGEAVVTARAGDCEKKICVTVCNASPCLI